MAIFHTDTWSPGDVHIALLEHNGQTVIYHKVKGNVGVYFTAYPVPVNTPLRVRIVYSGSQQTKWLYVDDVLVETTTARPLGTVPVYTAGHIGCWTGGQRVLDGSVEGFELIAGLVTPTSSPTPAPTPSVAVAAKGDPHLTNIYGQHFDVNQPGDHVLVQIPRAALSSDTFLRLQARAEKVGGACADMYFRSLNFTGAWVSGGRGLYFSSSSAAEKWPAWMTFGVVKAKVVHGRTDTGVAYLNIMLKNLGAVPFPVGGLLGVDDHTQAAARPAGCARRMIV